ncbi:Orsellinic acid biosynthesis cluster protein D [Pseudocercospora fuligena]|uniref:Orsellinic acid biosynthesis cluster protein D n=1 Tax=Pseudocercospora fuligena TaxID=685502 RepID=A0A8H6RA07_9PEZI|nr:Orsellinic acid biosynthesis cluster protein D [Pseudocercospora fuligena]
MSQHWSDVHGERESRNVHARHAWLQTFFRGNKIRYFEVSRPLAVSPKARAVSAERAEFKHAIEGHSGPPNLSSALDMASLKYLLHWKECTALTMPRTECETTYFWSTTISHDALRHPFLMGGILGMAALHLAETEPDLMEAQKHYEAMLRYSVASVAEFRKVQDRPDLRNCTALIAYSRLMCIQQCCPGDASEFRQPISKSSLRDPTPLYQALCLNRGLLDILLSTQHLLADGSDFKYPKEEIEDLIPLDDPVAALEDASNVAKIPQAMRLKLQHLSAYIAEMLQCCEVCDILDLQACLDASTALTSAFARAYSSATPYLHSADLFIGCPHPKTVRFVWSGVESWLRTISEHYVGLCEQGKPVALVIFAHWAMLLHRWRYRYWYFRNLKDGTLHLIEANLDDHMKPWISDLWAIEEIM